MRTHENSAMASLDENLEQVEKELLEEADVVEEVYEKVVLILNVRDGSLLQHVFLVLQEEISSDDKDEDIMEQEVKEQDMIEEKVVADEQNKSQGRRVSRYAGKVFVCKVGSRY